VRDGAPFIEASVRSILGQTLRDIELVVIDDGSVDQTPELLRRLCSHDSRLRVEPATGTGLVAALNQGCLSARAKLLARMDADDVALPNRLATQVELLERDPGLGVVGSAVIVVDEVRRPLYTMRFPTSDPAIRRALSTGSAFAHPTVVMRRDLVERAGGYRPAFLNAEDYDLWLRMAELCRMANQAQPLLEYRLQAHQSSRQYVEQQQLSAIAARISAQARLTGATDEVSCLQRITRGSLVKLGLSRADLENQLVRGAASQALFLCLVGKPVEAGTILNWAMSLREGSLSPHARTLIVSGIAAWLLGHRAHGLMQAARGSLLDLPYALSMVAKALAAWHSDLSEGAQRRATPRKA
jgi:glycosyl transferase family 2